MEKKATLSTLKSFVRKNLGNIVVRKKSNFDGMVDCVMPQYSEELIENVNFEDKYKWGTKLIWLVGGSRDSIQRTENGFNVYNCCGEYDIEIIEHK